MRFLLLMGLALGAVSAWLRQLNLFPAAEFSGTVMTSFFQFTATVDPAVHAAGASVDTTIATTLIKANDVIVAIPPATFTAGVAVTGTHTVVDGSFKVRTTNPSAGIIDPAAGTWTFLVFRR